MDPLLGAALVQGGTALASSLFNIGSQSYINNQNIEEQRRAQAQAQRNWLAQQEYNSPKNQVARIQEAGLNPDMLYGQSAGGVAGNAPAPAPVVPPATLNPGMLDPMVMSNVAESISRQQLNKTQHKNLEEITKGLGFENIIKELNSKFPQALLKELDSRVIEVDGDEPGSKKKISLLDSFAEDYISTQIGAAFTNNDIMRLTQEIYQKLVDKFGRYKELDGTGKRLWELNDDGMKLVSMLFDINMNEIETNKFVSSFERAVARNKNSNSKFWINSELLQQRVANAVAQLTEKNANIETDFLNGEITMETFLKLILVILSQAGNSIPGVITNMTRQKPVSNNQRTININNYQPRQSGYKSKYESVPM